MYLELKKNSKGYTHLEVHTSYDKGGYNLFTGYYDNRGYFVLCVPVEKSNGMIRHALFEGRKEFIEPAKRFSRKKLAALDDDTLNNAKNVISTVLNTYGLQLA